MKLRTSSALWQGNLKDGGGTVRLGSGHFEGPYTFFSRFEDGKETNPEELLGAANAACYSMFLSAILSKDGFPPTRISTKANVHLEDGPKISLIEFDVEAEVPGIQQEAFLTYAEDAKKNCPVSVALSAVPHTLKATLVK
jgi:lipoyl-dependent peroxiredoxin